MLGGVNFRTRTIIEFEAPCKAHGLVQTGQACQTYSLLLVLCASPAPGGG